MASTIQLKRSAQSGKVPDTGSLNLGELAINTYDGKIYFKKSGSVESVESVLTTNSTVTGSIRLEGTGSFGSLKVNDTLTINHGEAIISGSALVTSDLTILGAVNARQFNISVISSSVLFESGSSRFGNTLDDTHDFTGSVNVTGSLYLNGVAVGGASNSGSFTGSFTGSFSGDGSGLRGVVSDDIPRDGWDYDSNSSASISDFNTVSDKYFIDFEQSQSTAVGTPVGYKGFLTNVSGSTQILPTLDSIDFIVGDTLVASIGASGIQTQPSAGTVSGSSQLTSSYDSRYVLSGSITQTTWDNIASKPGGIISGSSQLTSSVLATTGSNTFVGTQTLSGSIIPAIDNTYDLGSATYQWRDIYVSSGSLYIDGTKVLGSTGNELQITTDVGQSIKILEAGSDSIILQSADGDIQLKTSGGGNLLFDPTTGLIDVRGTLQIQDGNKITSSGGLGVVFGNNILVSGSIESTGTINGINLSTFSSSVATQISTIQTKTGSFATTGSNSFIGNQNISGTIYLTGSIIPSGSFVYDLGSETNSFRDLFLSTGSIRFHNPDGTEQGRITVDASSGDISLLKTAGLTNEQKATIGQGNINPNFLSAVSASNLFVQNKIVLPIGGTVHGINLTAFSSSVSSTIINQNTATSSYETKGRGIISGSSQLNNASIENLTVINLTTINETASVIFSSGSNRFGDFGDDIHSFTGSVQISGSITTVGSSTATSFSGAIASTNGVVSGSSQITSFGFISSSASIPTGTVSGSSQINVMSTTNIARLATTGSNTFSSANTFSNTVNVQNFLSISSASTLNAPSSGKSIEMVYRVDGANDYAFIQTYDRTNSILKPLRIYASTLSLNGGGEGNVGFGLTNAQSQVHLNGTITFTESGFDTVRKHTITHGHSDGSSANNYVAINVSDGTGTTAERIRVNGSGQLLPAANGTQDLGSTSLRWGTIYTSDLSLNNGIGDWTIVEGEDDLFLYNNKKGKVYKFALTEVDPNVATPKKS